MENNKENNVQFVVFKKLENLPIKKVVDLGAGNGALFYALKEKGIEVKASDISPQFKECKKADYNKGLPYKNEEFDCVISIGVIDVLDNPSFFLKEIKRIAKPGAHIIISTPNYSNIINRIYYLFTGIPLYVKIYNDLKCVCNPIYLSSFHTYFKRFSFQVKEIYYNKAVIPIIRRRWLPATSLCGETVFIHLVKK